VSNLRRKLLVLIAVMLCASVFLIWNGLRRNDSTGAVIATSGVIGLLSMVAFVAKIIVRSRKQ
jgi:ACR3 family arsenite efflux pump ArsB